VNYDIQPTFAKSILQIAYAITGDTETAFKIGIIEVILKIFIYYFHERIWQLIPRGTARKWCRERT
jgi:uncharacterized membrane protein